MAVPNHQMVGTTMKVIVQSSRRILKVQREQLRSDQLPTECDVPPRRAVTLGDDRRVAVLREQRFLLDFGERAAEDRCLFIYPGLQVFRQLREDVFLLRPFPQVHPNRGDIVIEERHQATFRRIRFSARLMPLHSSRRASSMTLPSRERR